MVHAHTMEDASMSVLCREVVKRMDGAEDVRVGSKFSEKIAPKILRSGVMMCDVPKLCRHSKRKKYLSD